MVRKSSLLFDIVRKYLDLFVIIRYSSDKKRKIYLLVDGVGSISRGSTTTEDSSSESG